MRYISPIQRLELHRNDGKIINQPFYNGELIVGDDFSRNGTTIGGGTPKAAYVLDCIDKTDASEDVQLLPKYPTDLSGATYPGGNMWEGAGMGTLDGIPMSAPSTPLGSLESGYRIFYEAPKLPLSGAADTYVSTFSGVYYEVFYGTAWHNGVPYTHGEEFMTIGTSGTSGVSGTGSIALTLPPALRVDYDQHYTEWSKLKYANIGDESMNIYAPDYPGGSIPKAGDSTSGADWRGWVR